MMKMNTKVDENGKESKCCRVATKTCRSCDARARKNARARSKCHTRAEKQNTAVRRALMDPSGPDFPQFELSIASLENICILLTTFIHIHLFYYHTFDRGNKKDSRFEGGTKTETIQQWRRSRFDFRHGFRRLASMMSMTPRTVRTHNSTNPRKKDMTRKKRGFGSRSMSMMLMIRHKMISIASKLA